MARLTIHVVLLYVQLRLYSDCFWHIKHLIGPDAALAPLTSSLSDSPALIRIFLKQSIAVSAVFQVHLFGASLGGFLAQKFAEYTHKSPRVHSLILCNSFSDTAIFNQTWTANRYYSWSCFWFTPPPLTTTHVCFLVEIQQLLADARFHVEEDCSTELCQRTSGLKNGRRNWFYGGQSKWIVLSFIVWDDGMHLC